MSGKGLQKALGLAKQISKRDEVGDAGKSLQALSARSKGMDYLAGVNGSFLKKEGKKSIAVTSAIPLNQEEIERCTHFIQSNVEATRCMSTLQAALLTHAPEYDGKEVPAMKTFCIKAMAQMYSVGFIVFTIMWDAEMKCWLPQIVPMEAVHVASISSVWMPETGFTREYTVTLRRSPQSEVPLYVLEDSEWAPNDQGHLRSPVLSLLPEVLTVHELSECISSLEQTRSKCQFAVQRPNDSGASGGTYENLSRYEQAEALITEQQQKSQLRYANAQLRHDVSEFVARIKGIEPSTGTTKEREYEISEGWAVAPMPISSSGLSLLDLWGWNQSRVCCVLGVPPELGFRSRITGGGGKFKEAMSDYFLILRTTTVAIKSKLIWYMKTAFMLINHPEENIDSTSISSKFDWGMKTSPLITAEDLMTLRNTSAITQTEYIDAVRNSFTLEDAEGKAMKELLVEEEERNRPEPVAAQAPAKPAPAPTPAQPAKKPEQDPTDDQPRKRERSAAKKNKKRAGGSDSSDSDSDSSSSSGSDSDSDGGKPKRAKPSKK